MHTHTQIFGWTKNCDGTGNLRAEGTGSVCFKFSSFFCFVFFEAGSTCVVAQAGLNSQQPSCLGFLSAGMTGAPPCMQLVLLYAGLGEHFFQQAEKSENGQAWARMMWRKEEEIDWQAWQCILLSQDQGAEAG